MLLLDSAMEFGGLTVYRDHADARTFHYLGGAPAPVAREGRPAVELLVYRGEDRGGLLTLEVELTLPPRALEFARASLIERFGDPIHLVPVLFDEGTVRIAVLDAAPPVTPPEPPPAPPVTPPAPAPEPPPAPPVTPPAPAPEPPPAPENAASQHRPPAARPHLVERVLGSATPSLLGRLRAIFAVRLDPAGAALARAALDGGALPLIVSYDLGFTGLRPARAARVRVRYAMAYDYLRARAAGATLYGLADLDAESESLRREGHIEIEDLAFTPEGEEARARRRDELQATVRELMQVIFFRPAASPHGLDASTVARRPAIAEAWAANDRARAAFVLRAHADREEREFVYDLHQSTAGPARAAPQAALVLPPGAPAPVREVDLDEALPSRVTLIAPAGSAWSGVVRVTLDVRTAAGEIHTLSITPEQPEASALLAPGPLDHRLRITARPEEDALGAAPPPSDAFLSLPARSVVIDPSGAARRREVELILGVVDPDAVVRVEATLRLGDAARTVTLTPLEPSVRVPVWGGDPLVLEARYHFTEGPSAVLTRPVPPSERVVLLNQPGDGFTVVQVDLVDPLARLQAVLVELSGPLGEAHKLLSLSADTPSGRWSMRRASPPPEAAPSTFRHRTRTLFVDGHVIEAPWREGGGGLLLVGDTDVRVERVEIVPLAAPSAPMMLRLTSLSPPPGVDGTVELFIDPAEASALAEARLPFRRDAPRRYRVERTLLEESVERPLPTIEETSEVLLL